MFHAFWKALDRAGWSFRDGRRSDCRAVSGHGAAIALVPSRDADGTTRLDRVAYSVTLVVPLTSSTACFAYPASVAADEFESTYESEAIRILSRGANGIGYDHQKNNSGN